MGTGEDTKRTTELPSPVQRLWRFQDKVGFWHDAYFTDEEIVEMKQKYPEVKWSEMTPEQRKKVYSDEKDRVRKMYPNPELLPW